MELVDTGFATRYRLLQPKDVVVIIIIIIIITSLGMQLQKKQTTTTTKNNKKTTTTIKPNNNQQTHTKNTNKPTTYLFRLILVPEALRINTVLIGYADI